MSSTALRTGVLDALGRATVSGQLRGLLLDRGLRGYLEARTGRGDAGGGGETHIRGRAGGGAAHGGAQGPLAHSPQAR